MARHVSCAADDDRRGRGLFRRMSPYKDFWKVADPTDPDALETIEAYLILAMMKVKS